MKAALLVALGGALGSALRFGLATATLRVTGSAFPWGTLAVNALGSLAIGFAAASFHARGAAWAFVIPGLLGGFTTFSAFSFETLELLREGRPLSALGYVLASVLGGLAAAGIGFALAHRD